MPGHNCIGFKDTFRNLRNFEASFCCKAGLSTYNTHEASAVSAVPCTWLVNAYGNHWEPRPCKTAEATKHGFYDACKSMTATRRNDCRRVQGCQRYLVATCCTCCVYIYIVCIYIYIGACIRIHYMLKFIQPAGQNALSGLFSHFSCSFIIELCGLQHTEATTPFQVCKIMLINIEC